MSILDRTLHKRDGAEINAVITQVLNNYCHKHNLSTPKQNLFRVSKAGNILIADRTLISNELLDSLNLRTKDKVKKLISCLKEQSIKEILSWSEKNTSSNLSGPECKKLELSDFDISGQVEEEVKEPLQDIFFRYHQIYVNELKEKLQKLSQKLDKSLIPEDVLSRSECPGRSLELNRKRLKYFVKCCCGLEAEIEIDTSKCRFLNQGEDIEKCIQNIVQYYLKAYKKFQIPELIKDFCTQAENISYDYFLSSRAYSELIELKAFKEAIEGQQKIDYLQYSNKWKIGTKTLSDITPETISSLIEKTFQFIQNNKLFLKVDARKIIKEIWETKGKEKYDECCQVWSELPFVAKLSAINSYKQLKIYAEECSKGNIQLLSSGRLTIGETEIQTINEESIVCVVELCLKDFKENAEHVEKIKYNQNIAQSILKVIEFSRPKKMGVTTVAAILTGSKTKKILERRLDKSPYYGILKNASQMSIINQIEKMKQNNILEIEYVGRQDMPCLRLTDEVRKILISSPAPEAILDKEDEGDKNKDMYIDEIKEAINKRAWDILEERSKKDISAEAALRVAAILWPTGKAAKITKTLH